MHSSGRRIDSSSTVSNFWYAISIDNSSTVKNEIPCPQREVMIISSLIPYGFSMLLGVLTCPLVIA